MAGPSIVPPKFEGDFTDWKRRMEVFLRTDLEIRFIMKYDFIAPMNQDGEEKEESQ